MLHQSYLETVEDSRFVTRSRERKALRETILAMEDAEKSPGDATKRATAIFEVNRLWSLLMEDLVSDENSYPQELKAGIISIGIFIIKRCEEMRGNPALDFAPLLEISRSVHRGLV